jgi:hypothetical protein
MATTTTATSKSVIGIKVAAYGMFALGLGLSVTHTVHFFHDTLGAALVSAIAAPVFIDGIQVIGKLARSAQFAQSTRSTGFKVQMFGALLSLIANVVAGPTAGDKILGVVFVGGYMFAEAFAERLHPASDDAAARAAAAEAQAKAERSERARRAAATKKANASNAKATKAAAAKAGTARRARTRQAKEDAAQFAGLADDARAYL